MTVQADLSAALDPAALPEPVPETPAPETVAKADFDALKSQLETAQRDLGGLKETAELVNKAKAIFLKQDEGESLSKEDVAVKNELLRIFPDLKSVGDLQTALKEIKGAAAAAQTGIAEAAWNAQQVLQREHGIAQNDPETAEMIGVNIREWINKDRSRQQRYFTGDKEVVREGFEHVVGKLFGPARLQRKRETINRSTNAPIVPARGGVAGGVPGSPSGDSKVDFSDKKAVRTALRSAFVGLDDQ